MAGLTVNDPVTFQQALNSYNIIPGDTILMRGGTYVASELGKSGRGSNAAGKGVFQLHWQGSSGKLITVKPYPGEYVRINGGIEIIEGSYIRLQNLDIAPTPTTRSFAEVPDYPDPLYITAIGCEIVNCYLHDGDLGIECFGTGGAKIYGNVMQNNGVYTGSQRGYDVYTHNNPGGAISIKRNLFMRPFTNTALHCYSPSNQLVDYTIDENIFVNAGITLGGSGLVQNNVISNNRGFRADFRSGVSDLTTNVDITLTGNYLHNGGIHSWWFEDVDIQNNTSIYLEGLDPPTTLYKLPSQGAGVVNWDHNTYYNTQWNLAVAGPFGYNDRVTETWKRFAEWQALGFDSNSTFSASVPTGTHITLKSNEYMNLNIADPLYDPHVGILSISNYGGSSSVPVNFSSLSLENGRSYRLRNGDNLAEYQQFTYNGSSVSVQMTGWTVAIPIAWDVPLAESSFPYFGCFVLEAV